MEGHWANSLCTLDSQIILYAMKIYVFSNRWDQEGPRKPFVGCFNLTRKEETQIYQCALILAPFFIEQKISLAVQALRQNLALRIDLRKHENMNQLTVKTCSITARRALENHLWHLLDEAVGHMSH